MVLKKVNKKDPIKSSLIFHPPKLSGALFAYGRVKSGKTVSLMTLAQIYHDHPARRYKIFDIFGGSRNENLYWALPSNKKKYWKYLEKKCKLSEPGPKQYKVNLLYPVTRKLPKKLPQNPPYVFSKPFTIDFKTIEAKHIQWVVGTLSNRDETLWETIISDAKRNSKIDYVFEKIDKEKAKKRSVVTNFVNPIVKMGLLNDKYSDINFDIDEELKDQETISVLCLDFVEEKYKLFVMGYIMAKMYESLKKRARQVIPIFREVHDFFRVTDQSTVPDRVKIFKADLANWIKMGRIGMHPLLDTQSPHETRGIVDGQQDLTIYGRLPAQADREQAVGQLRRDGLITSKLVEKMGSLNPGQFVVCPSGKQAYLQYFLLSRTMTWEEQSGNFYTRIWKNTINKWVNVEEEIEKVREQNQKAFRRENEEEEKKPEIIIQPTTTLNKKEDVNNDIKVESVSVNKEVGEGLGHNPTPTSNIQESEPEPPKPTKPEDISMDDMLMDL